MGSNFVLIDSLYEQGLNDTLYIDSVYPLNTQNFPYSYKIELHNDEGLVDQPMIASSIFLSFIPNDNQLEIEFNKNTPWMNHQYVVYKENGINNFDSIGTSITNSYTDRNLVNGDTYCYMVKSIGSYDLPGYVNPIENDSHKNCGIPEDKTPPPPPVLTVYSICDSALNHLSWENEIWVDDIISYNVYYSTDVNTNLQFLTDINDRDSNFFDHFPTVGLGACYEVTAIDSFQNESIHSNRVCIDSCKYYELPNVFTPNGDNYNPYFIPTTSKRVIDLFIDKVEFKVFNRWGNLVFETDNIYLDWDGTNSTNGKLVSDGVYYYVCNVYERRITGSEPRYLVGFIHIFQSTEAGVAE
jgi:gliding motility-associated-like protein